MAMLDVKEILFVAVIIASSSDHISMRRTTVVILHPLLLTDLRKSLSRELH